MPSRRLDKDDFAQHVVEVRSFHPLDRVVPFVSKNETVYLTIDDKNSICRIFFLTLLLKPREYLGYQVFRAFVIPVYIRHRGHCAGFLVHADAFRTETAALLMQHLP